MPQTASLPPGKRNQLEKTVIGTIISTYRTNNVVLFNSDPDCRNTLTLVINKEHFADLGGAEQIEQELRGQAVKVKGVFSVY